MARLKLTNDAGAFLEARPVHRDERFGIAVQLRIPAQRGCSGFVMYAEFRWWKPQEFLESVANFVGKEGEPLKDGHISFQIHGAKGARAIFEARCSKMKFQIEIDRARVMTFHSKLMDVCQALVERAARAEAGRSVAPCRHN